MSDKNVINPASGTHSAYRIKYTRVPRTGSILVTTGAQPNKKLVIQDVKLIIKVTRKMLVIGLGFPMHFPQKYGMINVTMLDQGIFIHVSHTGFKLS